MAENKFLDQMILRLVDGESSLSYREFMLENFSLWNNVDVPEITTIVKYASMNKSSLYSFLTFWHNIVGVDLIPLVLVNYDKNYINEEDLNSVLTAFPKALTISHFSELDRQGLSITSFREIRWKLAESGIEKVRSIKFEWGD